MSIAHHFFSFFKHHFCPAVQQHRNTAHHTSQDVPSAVPGCVCTATPQSRIDLLGSPPSLHAQTKHYCGSTECPGTAYTWVNSTCVQSGPFAVLNVKSGPFSSPHLCSQTQAGNSSLVGGSCSHLSSHFQSTSVQPLKHQSDQCPVCAICSKAVLEMPAFQ